MNNSYTNNSELIKSLTETKDILENYGIRLISIIGVVFNTYSLNVLPRKKADQSLTFKFYDFLWCRCFCNLLVCFFGIFFNPNIKLSLSCKECQSDYWQLYLQVFLNVIPLRIAFMSSAISDILLILNRVALLFDKRSNYLYKISIKVGIFFS